MSGPRFAAPNGGRVGAGRGVLQTGEGFRVTDGRRWPPLLLAVSALMLSYVWRLPALLSLPPQLRTAGVLLVVVIVLFFLDAGAQARLKQRLRSTPLRMALALFVVAILSIPTSIYQGGSFNFITSDFGKTILLMLVIVGAVRGLQDIERLAGVLLAGAVLYCWSSLTFTGGIGGRLGGPTYYDPNDLALMILCVLPIALYFLIRKKNVVIRLAVLGAVALFLYIFLLTVSRGGFVALAFLGIYVLFFFRTIPLKVRLSTLGAAVTVFALAAPEGYWDRMGTILNPQEDYNWAGESEGGRIEVWKRGIGYMKERPLLGVGVAQFGSAEAVLSEMAERQMYGIGVRRSAAHNAYVQVGAELGVFGLLIFLVMLGSSLRDVRRLESNGGGRGADPPVQVAAMGQAFSAGLIAFIAGSMFLSFAYYVILYVLVGLMVALVNASREGRGSLSNSGLADRPLVSRSAGWSDRRFAWRRTGGSPAIPPRSTGEASCT